MLIRWQSNCIQLVDRFHHQWQTMIYSIETKKWFQTASFEIIIPGTNLHRRALFCHQNHLNGECSVLTICHLIQCAGDYTQSIHIHVWNSQHMKKKEREKEERRRRRRRWRGREEEEEEEEEEGLPVSGMSTLVSQRRRRRRRRSACVRDVHISFPKWHTQSCCQFKIQKQFHGLM